MSQPSSSSTSRYRFCRPPEETEVEVRELDGDEAAEAHARELSTTEDSPIVIQRLHGHVDWRYLTEVDGRPG